MRSIHNILVSIAPAPGSLALQRAKQLALKLDAALDLLVCDPHQNQSEFIEQQLDELRCQGIRAQGEQARVDIDHASASILATCRTLDSDLLIKQHRHPFNALQRSLLMPPDDWQLMRQSPAPLLLVKSNSSWAGGTVLAAMDVEHRDATHQALQGNVINHASELCQLFDAHLHVVSAYAPARLPQADSTARLDEASAFHCRDQCQWFQDEYELSEQRLHIGEGPAKHLIPRVARQFGAVLTVLGTVARHGLSGALFGNTAEAVLKHLDGDVLVLKPHTPDSQQADRAV